MGDKTWRHVAANDEHVVYLVPPSPGSHEEAALNQLQLADGLVILSGLEIEDIDKQVALANAFETGTPLDAVVIDTAAARIASLDWAISTADPDRTDIFQYATTLSRTLREVAAIVEASYFVYPEADDRASSLLGVLGNLTTLSAAAAVLGVLADSESAASREAFTSALYGSPEMRAAALRHLHRIQTNADIDWYLMQAITYELDSSVRAALTQYFAISGADVMLRAMYPQDLPTNPVLRRAYLFGQARSGTPAGWNKIREAADDPEPATRIMAFDAAAVLARSEASLAPQANDWLLEAQPDNNFIVHLAQTWAVGRLTPSPERRQWLASVASASMTPVDVAYTAAFHLMAECTSAVTTYAAAVSAATPHAAVSQAINTTLAAWDANGGPTCE